MCRYVLQMQILFKWGPNEVWVCYTGDKLPNCASFYIATKPEVAKSELHTWCNALGLGLLLYIGVLLG